MFDPFILKIESKTKDISDEKTTIRYKLNKVVPNEVREYYRSKLLSIIRQKPSFILLDAFDLNLPLFKIEIPKNKESLFESLEHKIYELFEISGHLAETPFSTKVIEIIAEEHFKPESITPINATSDSILPVREFESPTPICPYCNGQLDQFPKRKKKCPYCSNYIYVRTIPENRKRALVTEKQKVEIDKQWEKENEWNNRYRITKEEYYSKKEILSQKFGTEAKWGDVIWRTLVGRTLSAKSFNELTMLYFQKALFLYDEGRKQYFKMLQVSKVFKLKNYKNDGIEMVQISTCQDNSCESCSKLEGKIYSIDEALKEMPIPNINCEYDWNDVGTGWCRCDWLPVLDD
ncbi:MAG TPA: hypothetical protein GX009_12855 [Candidatus Atribacteria bacterium]|nr:hypothetical protein [Candidatus Atribacteria bacterium]